MSTDTDMLEEQVRCLENENRQLRENNAEVVRIQRQIKHLCQELLTVQRRSAAIADALSLEAQR